MTRHTAAYHTVRHLAHQAAARQLGLDESSVRQYRRDHPDVAYEPQDDCDPNRRTISVAVPVTSPSQSATTGPRMMARVTLPAPPWGGGFEGRGVRA